MLRMSLITTFMTTRFCSKLFPNTKFPPQTSAENQIAWYMKWLCAVFYNAVHLQCIVNSGHALFIMRKNGSIQMVLVSCLIIPSLWVLPLFQVIFSGYNKNWLKSCWKYARLSFGAFQVLRVELFSDWLFSGLPFGEIIHVLNVLAAVKTPLAG